MKEINANDALAENERTNQESTFVKPTLELTNSYAKISKIEEMIEKNFKLPIDPNNSCRFYIQNKAIASMPITTDVYRILRSLYLTVGRLPAEMEALCFLQSYVIANIVNFTSTDAAIDKLQSIMSKSSMVETIVKCLTRLCSQGI